MGPPADRDAAIAVLRRAVELGVDHIDTERLLRPAPAWMSSSARPCIPMPDGLTNRDQGSALAFGHPRADGRYARSAEELRQAVHDNLDHLVLDVLDVANLRLLGFDAPVERSLAEPFEALVDPAAGSGLVLAPRGRQRDHPELAEAQSIGRVVCVQNHYNLVHRPATTRLIDALAREGDRLRAVRPARRVLAQDPVGSPGVDRWPGIWRRRRWRWRSPGCSPARRTCWSSPGRTSVAHLEENLESARPGSVGPVELAELRPDRRHRQPRPRTVRSLKP